MVRLPQHLQEGRQRVGLLDGVARGVEHETGVALESPLEVAGETRLADARLPREQHRPSVPTQRAAPPVHDHAELRRSAHQLRVTREPARLPPVWSRAGRDRPGQGLVHDLRHAAAVHLGGHPPHLLRRRL